MLYGFLLETFNPPEVGGEHVAGEILFVCWVSGLPSLMPPCSAATLNYKLYLSYYKL